MPRPSHSSTKDSVGSAILVGSSDMDEGFSVEFESYNWEI
jgi:hypothetical protein